MAVEKKAPTTKQLAARQRFADMRKKNSVERQPERPDASRPFESVGFDTFTGKQIDASDAVYTPAYTTTQKQHTMYSEATVAEITPFRPKKGELVIDETKTYEFELCTRREEGRPKDKDSGLPLGLGFQPSFSIPNQGVALNKAANKWESWRYIEGQPSCFVSEQPQLENYEPKDISRMLGQPENDLEFRDGRMLVRGDISGKLRLQALFLSDFFIENPNPKEKKPAMWMFKLNNPDAVVESQNDIEDLAFLTMSQARNCTITEMLAVSLLLGINIDDTSPAGMNRIKNAFLNKAKYDPNNPKGLQFFMEVINNPATKMKYIFAQGLFRGLISTIQAPGKLTWAKLATPILDLRGTTPTADELTARAIDKDKIVLALMAELEQQLNNA